MTQGDPGTEEQSNSPVGVSTPVKRWTAMVAVLLTLWFFFAWLVLDRHMLDAAGESVGTALAVGIVVSLVGALRSSR